jgi:hypothetical protein
VHSDSDHPHVVLVRSLEPIAALAAAAAFSVIPSPNAKESDAERLRRTSVSADGAMFVVLPHASLLRQVLLETLSTGGDAVHWR